MFRLDQTFRDEFRENWLPLAVAFSCLFFGLSIGAFALPFIYPEVIEEFGWTREQATLLASAKYVVGALSAVFFGRLVDLAGVWVSLFITMVMAGVALVSFIWMSDLTMYYLSGVLLGVAAGGGMVSAKILVSRAFNASQGTAMGMALMGTAIGATVVPILIAFLMDALGWRLGIAAASLSIWLICLPLLFLGWRASRVRAPSAVTQTIGHERSTVSLRLHDYLGQRNFWFVGGAIFIAAAVDTGFTQHQVLILRDFNFSNVATAAIMSAIGLASVLSRVPVGNILDGRSTQGLAVLYLTLLVAALSGAFLSAPLVLVVFMACRAVGHAAVLLDSAVIPKHVFGNSKDLGTLIGVFTACSSLGFATGPWIMGRIFDVAGSYLPAYVLFGVLALVAAGMAWAVTPTHWMTLRRPAEEREPNAAASG